MLDKTRPLDTTALRIFQMLAAQAKNVFEAIYFPLWFFYQRFVELYKKQFESDFLSCFQVPLQKLYMIVILRFHRYT